MKLDKKKSIKNKIGIIFSTLLLTNFITQKQAIAEENTSIKINYIYDEDDTLKNEIDNENYNLVEISDIEMNNYIVLTSNQFNYILTNQTGEKVKINGIEFSREELENANNIVKNKIDEEKSEEEANNELLFKIVILAAVGIVLFIYRYENLYLINRAIQKIKRR